jgi:hypothetical protein
MDPIAAAVIIGCSALVLFGASIAVYFMFMGECGAAATATAQRVSAGGALVRKHAVSAWNKTKRGPGTRPAAGQGSSGGGSKKTFLQRGRDALNGLGGGDKTKNAEPASAGTAPAGGYAQLQETPRGQQARPGPPGAPQRDPASFPGAPQGRPASFDPTRAPPYAPPAPPYAPSVRT